MALDYKNFLRPISPGDRYIQVIKDNVVIHTINPFSIENIYVSANLVKVNLKSDKLILLDFYNITESRAALLILQSQIDTLKSNIPYYVSKDVENYVTSEIDKNMSNLIGPTGPQGATGPQGSVNLPTSASYSVLLADGLSGVTVSNNLRFIDTNKLKIIGTTELQQTIEVVNEGIDGATVSYDYNLGSIWIHDQNLTQDYTANFQNLPNYDMGEFKAISLTIVINQTASAWIPTDFQNDGTPITVKWANGNTPSSGNANQTDVISLTLLSSSISLGNFYTFH